MKSTEGLVLVAVISALISLGIVLADEAISPSSVEEEFTEVFLAMRQRLQQAVTNRDVTQKLDVGKEPEEDGREPEEDGREPEEDRVGWEDEDIVGGDWGNDWGNGGWANGEETTLSLTEDEDGQAEDDVDGGDIQRSNNSETWLLGNGHSIILTNLDKDNPDWWGV